MAWTQDASTSQVDPAVQQAARLEVELAGYKDTSPEAADLLAKIMDLYYSSGHVFGVIRTGQKFTARHSGDKRHQAMMLKLLDGLEAVSRNEEIITTCRQFLDRYPNDPASASVEVRLARTLERGDRLAGAGAWQAVWRRQGNTAAGREAGARALGLCESLRSGEAVKLANEIAGEMVDKLPATELTGEIGMRTFNLLASAGQYAEANSLANKMLAKGQPADKVLLRGLHRRMAYNYQQVRQYANAAVSLKKALAYWRTCW